MIRAQDVLYPRSRGSLFQWLTLLLVAALLTGVACKDDDDDDSSRGGAGTDTPPGELSVEGTEPADGATGVSNETPIEVRFSAPLDTGTVDASSFEVTGSASGPLGGTYSFGDGDATAIFSPGAPYAYEETVEVRVTTAVVSRDGDQLDEELRFSFTVEEEPSPPAALEVLGTQPPDGATGVSRMAQIQVVFSDVLDESTVTPESFRVTGSASGGIEGVYSLADGGQTALFSPAAAYAFAETVEVLLSTALSSPQGGRLAAETVFSFTVEDDPGGPGPVETLATVDTTPEPYAQGVAPDPAITVLFSHPLDPATVTAESVWLSSPLTGRVVADITLAEENRRVDVAPGRPFHAGEVVTVHLGSAIDPVAEDVVFHGHAFVFQVRSAALDLENSETRVVSAAGTVRGMGAADLNLDGAVDLVYRVENGTSLYFLLGDGRGGLTAADPIDVGQMLLSMATADVDRDGDLDIVAGTADRTRLYLNEAADNPGAGTLQIIAGPEVSSAAAVRGIAIADIDHDSGLDYVLDTDLGIRVHLGSLTAVAAQALGDSRQATGAPVLADLDLDGQADLVYGDLATGAVAYHMGLGPAGSADAEGAVFGERRTVDLTGGALQVAVDSFEPGERPEIVVLTMDGASRQGQALRLLASDGQGGYTVTGFTGGDAPPDEPPGEGDPLDRGHFTIADLEGDARPDVVLAATATDQVVWLRNREGEAPPAAGDVLLSAPMPWSVLAADLTGDGVQNVLASAMNEIHALLPKEVEPPPPEDTFALSIAGSEARQGDTGVAALIRLTSSAPLGGYEIYVTFDPAALTPTATSTEGTALETDAPEFVFFEVREASSTIALSAIMEFQPPFEGRTLPPQDDAPLLRVLFDVPEAAPTGETRLEFTNDTVLVSDGRSKTPATTAGVMTILAKEEPPPPPTGNWKRIVDASIDAGMEGLVEIRGGAEEKVDAFTTIVGFDPDIFEIKGIELEGSATSQHAPELEVADLQQEQGYFAYTVIFDFLAPFDRQAIPAGQDFHLFSARFRVRNGTADGSYPLTFRNEVGSPALFNIYAFGGRSIFPQLIGGEVSVRASTETLFIRGDANTTRDLDISDAIFTIAHLFRGGAAPPCLDAADTDDDGSVALTDPLFLLLYIFKAGDLPPAPFPEPGTDPTADDLDCAEGL